MLAEVALETVSEKSEEARTAYHLCKGIWLSDLMETLPSRYISLCASVSRRISHCCSPACHDLSIRQKWICWSSHLQCGIVLRNSALQKDVCMPLCRHFSRPLFGLALKGLEPFKICSCCVPKGGLLTLRSATSLMTWRWDFVSSLASFLLFGRSCRRSSIRCLYLQSCQHVRIIDRTMSIDGVQMSKCLWRY